MSKRCNCGTVWCALDTLLHRAHVKVGWICDRHDKGIWDRFDIPR
jgi:hypothetical protein